MPDDTLPRAVGNVGQEHHDTTDHPGSDPGPAFARLEEQLAWYDRQAAGNKLWFRVLKVGQIVIAAAIPVLAAAGGSAPLAGGFGATIVVLEGFQQLFQFQQNWITYRATAEALKHEKFLYAASAGPYGRTQRPDALLAERVEGLVSQEQSAWTSTQTDAAAFKAGQRD